MGERTFNAGTPGIARIDWYGRELLRPYATFPHPNVLGGFLATVLLLIVLRYLSILGNLKKKIKLFYGTVILVGITALLLTFSRSAIVVGTIAIAIAIARNVEHKLRVLGIVLFVFILTSYVLRLTSTEESVVVRQQLNDAAIKLWQSSPLFGVGLGNFLVRLPEALPTRTIYFLQPVHNIYLLLLSEMGIVGIGLIVLWIAWRLNYEFRIRNYGKNSTKEIFIIHTSLFIILLLGLVDHYPLTLQQGQLMFTVLAGMSLTFVH
ncbi:MAG: O-antigen ligase family protein [Patescibacteria group bacterium]